MVAIIFFQADVHIWLTTPPTPHPTPVRICPLLPDPPKDIVMNILKEIDPEGTNMRKALSLRRRKYVSEGPNCWWHAGGYYKLKPYGFPIHGCIDGYLRRILWLKVTKSNSHAKVPAAYYVDTMKELGVCPKLLQTDCGTENVLMAAIQSRLQ